MKKITLLIYLIIFNMNASSFAQRADSGGQIVGNAGDPVKLAFAKAKIDAVNIFDQLNWTENTTLSDDGKDFLKLQSLDMIIKIKNDIALSEHFWTNQFDQPTCAMTNVIGFNSSTLVLNYNKCQEVYKIFGQDYITKLIIHEALHHFGISGHPTDENFADKISHEIFESWKIQLELNKAVWQPTPNINSPSERMDHVSVDISDYHSNYKIFIFGGCNTSFLPTGSCSKYLNDSYILTDKEWITLPQAPISGRKKAQAAFDGENILIFGGCNALDASCKNILSDGAIYNLKSNTWTKLPESNFSGRVSHTVTYGKAGQFLVWGGLSNHQKILNDGFIVNIKNNHIAIEAITNSELLLPRFGHEAVFTGENWLIFGGCKSQSLLKQCKEAYKDGFSLSIDSKSWTKLPTTLQNFKPRTDAASIWTGRLFIIFGGQINNSTMNDGIMFDVLTNLWYEVSDLLPKNIDGRYDHQLSWDGKKLLIFGGKNKNQFTTGDVLSLTWLHDFPFEQSWEMIETTSLPLGRIGHSQHWIKGKLYIWGGQTENGFTEKGGILYLK